jgi:hypothetical protein
MFNSASYKERLLVALFCLIGWAGFLATPPASAQFKAWVMAKLPERPWGLGVDSKGNIYTSFPLTGEVVMLKDDGTYDHIAWVPSKEESGKQRDYHEKSSTVRALGPDQRCCVVWCAVRLLRLLTFP